MSEDTPLPPLESLSTHDVRKILLSLDPDNEMRAGVKLLLAVLDKQGVGGVQRYIKAADQILDREGKLEAMDFLHRKLTAFETEYQAALSRRVWSRRHFLSTGGAAISGAVFGAWGLLRTADQAVGYYEKATKQHEAAPAPNSAPTQNVIPRSRFRELAAKGYHLVDEHLMGPADLLIGAVLIEEALSSAREIRADDLNAMSNAVSVFQDYVSLDSPSLLHRT